MAKSTDIIAEVGRRIRDVAQFAHPNAVMLRFVDHIQKLLIVHEDADLTDDASLAVTPTARQALYPSGDGVAGGVMGSPVRIINAQGRNLPFTTFMDLVQTDPQWQRTEGNEILTWSMVGRDLLILYPTLGGKDVGDSVPAHAINLIQNRYTAQPLNDGSNDMALPDELVPVLRDFLEVLALVRARKYGEAAAPLQRVHDGLSRSEALNAQE